MSTPVQVTRINELFCSFRFKDEWPARVIDLISDLAKRHAARISASDDVAEEIACFLMDRANEHSAHVEIIGPTYRDAAGRTCHMVESSIGLENLGRDLTRTACERYPLKATA